MTKKINHVVLLAFMTTLSLVACKKDKAKTLPVVTTATPTEVTTTTAKAGGTITDNGNDAITEKGIVYSDVVAMPTLANNKVMATGSGNSFEVILSGLSSGSTYYIRAYATNSAGTAYGSAVELLTGNSAPVATGVNITGTPKGDELLTGNYAYSDAEGDAESGTTFQWYMANDAAGAGETKIDGATEKTFRVQNEQEGKYIRFGATPKAATGNQNGTEIKSAFVGAVGEATTVTFMYNDEEVTYGILTSAATQRKWLDRNLGAPNVASAYSDFANYGDLFQWGRLADGHQLTLRGASNGETSGVNSITSTLSASDVPSTNLFISNTSTSDWRSTPNVNLWQGVNGINNPCPEGWRIPTRQEWAAEGVTNADDGFSKLKLTLGGIRWYYDGSYQSTTDNGSYWTSDTNPDFFAPANYDFEIWVFFSMENTIERASGLSCRCIKNL